MKVSSHGVNIEGSNTTVPDDVMQGHVCVCWGSGGGGEWGGGRVCVRMVDGERSNNQRLRVGRRAGRRRAGSLLPTVGVSDGIQVRKTFMRGAFSCTVASGWSGRREPAVGWRRRSALGLVYWPAASEIIHLRQHNLKIWVIWGLLWMECQKPLTFFCIKEKKNPRKTCQLVKAVTKRVFCQVTRTSQKKCFQLAFMRKPADPPAGSALQTFRKC